MLDETLPPARDHEAPPEPATHSPDSVVPQAADEPVAHDAQAPADATDAGGDGSHQSDALPGVETTVETCAATGSLTSGNTTAAASGESGEPHAQAAEPGTPQVHLDDAAEAAPAAASAGAPAGPAPQAEMTPAACAALLAERFPGLFAAGRALPIKLRVQVDIQARAPGVFPRKAMSLFLHRYTTSTAYLKALVALPHRFDLDGAPAGDVAAEHREAAQVELQRRQAIVQEKRTAQRRMDRPPRPGQGPRAGAHGQAGLQPVSDAAAQANAAPENAAPENVPAGVDNSSQSPAPGSRPGRPARQPRPPRRDAQRPPRQDRPASGNPMPGPQGQGRGDGSQRGPRQAMPPRRDGGVDSASLSHGAGRRDRPSIDSERQADSASPRPAALPPAEIEARRERAALLRAYESSTLTKSNFCVLKRVSEADLDAALTQARQERGESMPRPHHR